MLIALVVAVLFMKVIASNMKTSISDIAVTLFGIFYITFFLSFISMLYSMKNGKYLIWFILISAWGTDTFAYLVGVKFGKHKFSKISPKKSIEGCVAGAVGAVIVSTIFMVISNNYWGTEFSYGMIAIVSLGLSLLSQIGDFVASSVKRFVDVKDYGNLLPGHGGMLDRIDSLMFLAPFAYVILSMM